MNLRRVVMIAMILCVVWWREREGTVSREERRGEESGIIMFLQFQIAGSAAC